PSPSSAPSSHASRPPLARRSRPPPAARRSEQPPPTEKAQRPRQASQPVHDLAGSTGTLSSAGRASRPAFEDPSRQKRIVMKRRSFDILMAMAGLLLAVTLIVSGALLSWGHSFIDNEVHTQLAAQKIFFPPAGSPAIKAPEFAAMRQYAG